VPSNFLPDASAVARELLGGADRVVRVPAVDDLDVGILLHHLLESLVVQDRRSVAGEPPM
jgi:hypothetical protein